MMITVETMKEVLDAFNRHDLDAIMEYFAEDCSFDFPRGPESYGQRFTGQAEVREALAGWASGCLGMDTHRDNHFRRKIKSEGV